MFGFEVNLYTMSYIIANRIFITKGELTTRCREILASTADGQLVSDESLPFLMELFQYHDEWQQKAGDGIRGISTQTTTQGTRCFVLVRNDESQIDISFPHAIRLIPSNRQADLTPQALRDFRSAARTTIESQIRTFRNDHLAQSPVCPITSEALHRGNSAVDHTPPSTFDVILFEFCQEKKINPLNVVVGSYQGTVAVFQDKELLASWQSWHQEHAVLRLVSNIGNLQLPKTYVEWSLLSQ